ncbi:hypothetical protein HG530_015647 [Fusarium avenaceum]|nr:hypothetical protein HG530_015647 [Fusarium avenaceum]
MRPSTGTQCTIYTLATSPQVSGHRWKSPYWSKTLGAARNRTGLRIDSEESVVSTGSYRCDCWDEPSIGVGHVGRNHDWGVRNRKTKVGIDSQLSERVVTEAKQATSLVENSRVIITGCDLRHVESLQSGDLVRLIVRTFGSVVPAQASNTQLAL